MRLKKQIQINLKKQNLFNASKTILLLILPLVLAASSLWIDWLANILPSPVSDTISNNSGALISIFSVMAGAYLTLYATYSRAKKEGKRKNSASKELAFYIPMFHELTKAKSHCELWEIEWVFWGEINNTVAKYFIPGIFSSKITVLDKGIKEYLAQYEKLSDYFNEMAYNIAIKAGIRENTRLSFFRVLDLIYLNKFTDNCHVLEYINRKENPIDLKLLAEDITNKISSTPQYKDFIQHSKTLSNLIDEVYEGLDYILMKIHQKYKGLNILM